MTSDPAEPIDVRNNPESRAAERSAPTPIARASAGGPPPKEAPPAGTSPEPATSGTAGGDPVSGVTISEPDLRDAVPADTGPDELGQRGPTSR